MMNRPNDMNILISFNYYEASSKFQSSRCISAFTGWYWAFSIIVTACYTGSVISFIAFPVFPALVETMKDVKEGGYRVGTLSTVSLQVNCT